MSTQKLNNLLKDPRTNWNFIGIVMIVGFLAGAGILGYYYWWIKDLETKLTEIETRLPIIKPPEKAIDETANWKIYRNEVLGIEFRYPKEYGEITKEILTKENDVGISRGEVMFIQFRQNPYYTVIAAYSPNFEGFMWGAYLGDTALTENCINPGEISKNFSKYPLGYGKSLGYCEYIKTVDSTIYYEIGLEFQPEASGVDIVQSAFFNLTGPYKGMEIRQYLPSDVGID